MIASSMRTIAAGSCSAFTAHSAIAEYATGKRRLVMVLS